MQSKERFALALRIIAVVGIICIVRNFGLLVGRGELPHALHLSIRLIYLAVGLYLLRGAPLLVKFAYPECSGTCGDQPQKAA